MPGYGYLYRYRVLDGFDWNTPATSRRVRMENSKNALGGRVSGTTELQIRRLRSEVITQQSITIGTGQGRDGAASSLGHAAYSPRCGRGLIIALCGLGGLVACVNP